MRIPCRMARAHRLSKLDRVLDEHARSEADLAALAVRWTADCGCRWDLPGAADPVWVPCDAHAERLLRAVEGEEEL